MRTGTLWRALALVLLLTLLLPFVGCGDAHDTGLRVEVLDVGQSDCTLIRQGAHAMMIDCGSATERSAVQSALAERQVERLDYLLLTHPHEDHIGNARMLIEGEHVGALILPPAEQGDAGYDWILHAATAHALPRHAARNGDVYLLGEARIEILFVNEVAEDLNDSSVILRIVYGSTVFLFTGDAEAPCEAALLSAVPAEMLRCDFLKAGHHGSDTSTGEALLRAASPAQAAISCGKENSYGFPHAALMERLAAAGAEVHRTDLEGTLCYTSDGERVIYEGEKHEQ